MAELSSVSFPRKPQAEAHSWASSPLSPVLGELACLSTGLCPHITHRGSPRPGRTVPLSRKTWPCGHHTYEGIIDGTTLNQGQGLKSPGPLWPWPLGTCWAVVTSSSPFCSAPTRTAAPAVPSVTCKCHLQRAQLHGGLLLDAPPWVGAELKPTRSLLGAGQCPASRLFSTTLWFLPFSFVLSGVFYRFPREGRPE